MKNRTPLRKLRRAYGLMNAEEQEQWDSHVRECRDCRMDSDFISSFVDSQRMEDKEIHVTRDFDIRTLADMKEAFQARRRPRPFFFNGPGWALTALAGVALILVLFLVPRQAILTTQGPVIIGNTKYEGSKAIAGISEFTVPEGSGVAIERRGDYSIRLKALTRFRYESVNSHELVLVMGIGYAEFEIRKKFGNINIKTVNAAVQVTGTRFDLEVDPEKIETIVTLKEGSVRVWNLADENNPLILQAGQKVLIRGSAGPELFQTDKPDLADDVRSENVQGPKLELKKNGQERIYLRNGNIIVGHIISQKDGMVTLQTHYGKLIYHSSDIEKIEYIP